MTTSTTVERTRRRRSAFDWDNGRRQYPAVDDNAAAWAQALQDQPDVLYAMIADIVKVAKATEGPRRTGRRPQISGLSVEDLWNTLYPPRYTTEPFTEAFHELLAGRSQRAFATRIPCNQATLSRLLAGRLVPDLPMLEAIATAAKVPPTYFVEYRAWKIGQLVGKVLEANPVMSIALIKRLARDST